MLQSCPSGLRRVALCLIAIALAAVTGYSTNATSIVFGPQTYTRGSGQPVSVVKTFRITSPSDGYTLYVAYHCGTSAVIALNGHTVLGPAEFAIQNKNGAKWDDGHDPHDNCGCIQILERLVAPRAGENQISVELRSKPGTSLTLAIVRTNVEHTPPTITAAVNPPPNANGWNNTSVTVTFTCADGGSGIATCPNPVVVSHEGAQQIVSGTAVDRAGNTAMASVTVNIDKTPPTIAASLSPPPNAAGWANAPVTVAFSCADGLSGVSTCSQPIVVGDGAQSVSGTVVDRAGNQAITTVAVNVDLTPPVITPSFSPQPNAAGWNNSDVRLTFECNDDRSGVVECPSPQLVTTEGPNQTVNGVVTDAAGNSATASLTLNVDKTPPDIRAVQTPPPNPNGWNNTPVSVTYDCADAGSGVDGCEPPITVGETGANRVARATTTDRAGNAASAEVTLNIDLVPPTIRAVLSAPPNEFGWHNGDVTVSFECADNDSGIGQCPAPQLISTDRANHEVVGNVTDLAGNAASASAVINLDKTAPVVTLSAPAEGATVQLSPIVASGSVQENGSGLQTLSCNGAALPVSGSTFTCERPLAAGVNTIDITTTDRAGNASAARVNVTFAPNRTPTITSQAPTAAAEDTAYSYQVIAGDPDGDALVFRLVTAPAGMTIAPASAIAWTPSSDQVGSHDVVVEVSDTRGGLDRQAYSVRVAAVRFQSINVAPEILRFSTLGSSRPLTVTASRSDGTSADVTASADTTYESVSPFVATVGADGDVKALANGSATISVRHQTFTDTAAVVVEAGVTLDALDLTPPTSTLRALTDSLALAVRGRFSDGETRDLTTADGTVYESSDAQIARVDSAGRVTPVSNGEVAITARHDALRAAATVRVAVSVGVGFLRGEVFDDAKGLPLGGATVALLADGGGPLTAPVTTTADERGVFALSGRAGDAVVRITTPGFTTVERREVIPANGAATLLDARLTPIDGRSNVIASAFGGAAQNAAGTVVLVVPPGGLPANVDVRVTPIGAQGLQGRLPLGWSPVAAVDVSPAGLVFAQPVLLTIPNVAGLPANTEVVVASYDGDRHEWVVRDGSHVSADGRSIATTMSASGQIACFAADGAPFAPPAPVVGDALAGVATVPLPDTVTASGEVIPRSAPPGDAARAVGRVLLQNATALPSGMVVQARVAERFDLTDQSQVVPQPFTEDIVLYARGRPSGNGLLGASFPITPSRSFTIQELLRGVVTLDITPPLEEAAASLVGAGGATVTNAAGDAMEVPAAALSADAIIELRRRSADQISLPVPQGFDLLAALDVDLVGVTLAQAARLSIPAAPSVSPADQLLLALVFQDPFGVQRLRLIGVAALESGRIVSRTTVGTLAFSGVVGGGQYLFLRSQQPVGFLTGQVFAPGGATPRAQALVTSDTAPFADASATSGLFIVAGRAVADVNVDGVDAVTRDGVTRTTRVNTRDEVVFIDLALAVVAPRVTTTNPTAQTTNVPLDQTIAVDFSEPIDPASVTDTGVTLQTAGGNVAGLRTLSSDRRRLVFRPSAPLEGKTAHTLALTGLRDLSGHALTGFAPLSFTTLDPSKPTVGSAGLITGELPDEDGFVLITGEAGAAEAQSPVTATNLRTQETLTVLANQDGSFLLRLAALIGDEIALALRDASRRETTIALTQLRSADGTTSAGEHGGRIAGANGRVGIILPRALSQPGLFRIDAPNVAAPAPPLPDGFTYADQFRFSIQAAQFNRLSSLTFTESQNRFPPESTASAPFAAQGELTVPDDFLVSASLRFTATAVDAGGVRRTALATTTVVAVGPDETRVESSQTTDFPAVFVVAPGQTLQNRLVQVDAFAPTARVDLELPAPPGIETASTLLLVRRTAVGGEPKLSFVDTLERIVRDGAPVLRTRGRDLPGMSTTGEYAIVASRDPLVFVTGLLAGPTAIATLDGSPFVFETDGPNGSFSLPTRAGQPFALRYLNAATGALLGTSSGQVPGSGALSLGQPLATVAAQLSLTVDPDSRAVADINAPLTFHFSEPVDGRTLVSSLIVTDDAGARVFGAVTLSSDSATATFKPSRRWRFGTTYRWGVAANVVGLSGARLAQQAGGELTTFAPRVVSTTALGTAHDVAVSGALAAVATDTGLTVVDASSPVAPVVNAQVPLAGGAHGLALVSGTSLTDRAGQTHTGTLAVVAAGDAGGVGRLEVFDVTTPTAPSAIGSTQLTTAPGQSAPPNVPAAAGTPNGVALTPDLRALVAVKSVGLESVRLAEAIPPDVAAPGRALGARYPAGGVENINHAALLGDRVVTVGSAGLTSLAATTFQRRGGISTSGDARGVAGLAAFSMDVNGDGTIAGETERFDLGVVANGADGTLQFYRVPATGDPALLSVVRFTGETTSVALDAKERVTYVGLGARGVALVDLDGPASVQPLDVDRNGADDRILGVIDTPGHAERLALALGRGMGFVADGTAGLTTLQLLPPRTTFQTLLRDPLKDRPGDEESILDTREAFTTDQAIRVTLNAAIADQVLSLVIEETPAGGGPRLLSFENGSTSVVLAAGLNAFVVDVAESSAGTGSRAVLKVQTTTGAVVTSLEIGLRRPDTTTVTLQTLLVTPATAVIAADRRTQQLSVGGLFSDGRVRNLTAAASGTRYATADSDVATVDPDGLITARAGGTAGISVANGGAVTLVQVTVDYPPSLVALEPSQTHLTLTAPGQQGSLEVQARFSDRTFNDAGRGLGSVFTSSDPNVVEVAADGTLIARSEGVATITITNGAVHQQVEVAVEFRTPTVLSAIALAPFNRVTTDAGEVLAEARLTGTGNLDDIPITFSIAGVALSPITIRSNGDGVAIAQFKPIADPGALTITASVVNPATGTPLTQSQAVTVLGGTADREPNNDLATASLIAFDRTVQGSITGGSDPNDVYRIESTIEGAATVTLRLDQATAPQGLALVFLSAAGAELQRFQPTARTGSATQAVAAGVTFLRLETTTGSIPYSLSARFSQAAVVLAAVSPSSGGPGTAVTIEGTGFSTDTGQNTVFFGHIAGKVTSATSTRLEAIVPANAVNGTLRVVVRARQATGPPFNTGNSGPPPAIVVPAAQGLVRFHPALGALVDLQRLIVQFDPLATRAEVEALASAQGGAIVGVLPDFNGYILEFPAVTTLRDLDEVRRQLRASSNVLLVSYDERVPVVQGLSQFDSRDGAGTFQGSVSVDVAYAQVRIFDAIEAIRRTPPFNVPLTAGQSPLNPVTVAVIDTGFGPDVSLLNSEFKDAAGQPVVQLIDPMGPPAGSNGLFPNVPYFLDLHGHGTAVTSVIAAVNSGQTGMTGVLNGLFMPGETPYRVLVYRSNNDGTGSVNLGAACASLLDIRRRGSVDAVNMSFGTTYGKLANAQLGRNVYGACLTGMGTTVVVAAAGNDGADIAYQAPAGLADRFDFLIAVGASAVTLGADKRAIFGGPTNRVSGRYEGAPCNPSDTISSNPIDVLLNRTVGLSNASNCGATITLAAPGQDVFDVTKTGYGRDQGTSVASPIVAGVAGLLRAIKSGLDARDVRDQLVAAADDISATWSPGPMKRLNALNAVQRLLNTPPRQAIYVADEAANQMVALEVDPFTGGPRAQVFPDQEIPLSFSKQGVTFNGQAPLSLAMSPAGEQLYALVEPKDPANLGDGILVVSTLSQRPVDFIPLSGARFPPSVNTPPPPAVHVAHPRAPMAISRDGYVLYVATGASVTVVNVAEGKVAKTYIDLPASYKLRASARPVAEMAQRLAQIKTRVVQGVQGRQGTTISALALSRDGKSLYAAFQTGAGGGEQPGGVVAINVDLYKDAAPNEFGLQSDLSSYLTVTGSTLEMQDAGPVGRGDEPTALAVGHDNRYVYMFNGGLSRVEGIGPEALFAARFAELIGGAGFGLGAATAGTGGIAGVLNAANDFVNRSGPRYAQLNREMQLLSDSGVGLLVAPGYTSVFDTQSEGQQGWLFPSEVVTGWNVGADTSVTIEADSGLMVTQFTFPEVFAKRPFAVAMKPGLPRENRRALVAFGHTGNFGVLDIGDQTKFDSATPPNPAIQSLPFDMFQAFVGVTPSIPLDAYTWPDRGAFYSSAADGSRTRVPSPDEALLFTSDIEYAQNGRFAVAAHPGKSVAPGTVPARIPDFVNDVNGARAALQQLGFSYTGGNTIRGPDGGTFVVGAPINLQRGGGAISIIDDAAITADFNDHLELPVTGDDGVERPYYSRIPICKTVTVEASTGEPLPRCGVEAVARVLEYTPSGGSPKRFHEPRAVAIQPFVMIETPRTGDHVALGSAINVTWRDDRVNRFRVTTYDLDNIGFDGEPEPLKTTSENLNADQLQARAMSAEFGGLFDAATDPNAKRPVHNTRYRVEVAMLKDSEELSSTYIDVRFENLTGSAPNTKLDLSPTILPGSGQLQALLKGSAAPPEDLTSQAVYSWLGGSTPGGSPLTIDTSALRGTIAGHLTASAGIPVSFPEIPVGSFSVSTTGAVTASASGLQAVRAASNGHDSRPTIVLSGFSVERISLEPIAAENVFEHGTLGAQVVKELGKGENAPLVITHTVQPFDNFIDDDGQIELDDVVLRYAGGGSIRLNDLMDALRTAGGGLTIEDDFQDAIFGNPAPIGSTPAWRHAEALVKLMEPASPSPSSSLLFNTSSSPTAFVLNGGRFNGRVASNSAGLALVAGKVDFGGFGTGTDAVVVWSLSPLESAKIKPAVTAIRPSDQPAPGPAIRTVASTAKADAVIPIPSGFSSLQSALQEILPRAFNRSGLTFPFDLSFGTDFTFTMSGGGSASPTALTFRDFVMSFDVPNEEPQQVTNTYSIADTTIATLGARKEFTQHVVHQNQIGLTEVEGTVRVEGMGGPTQATGQIVVCDCSGPIVVQRLLGPATVQAGDTVQYEIVVLNPTTAALTAVTITDEFRIDGVLVATNTINAGPIEADSFVKLPVQITAPAGGGVLQSTVSAPGFTPIQAPAVTVVSSTGSIIISEMVLDPKQDWNDSAGGNGAPFDGIPGNGTIDANDIWVEIMRPTTGTGTWVIRLTDATGATFSRALGPPTLVGPQVRVLSGFGPLALPILKVEVVDNNGLVRQTLDITAINQILGAGVDLDHESLTWSFFGSPTLVLQQFVRRAATIGAFLPF